jgi:hypothetical protein
MVFPEIRSPLLYPAELRRQKDRITERLTRDSARLIEEEDAFSTIVIGIRPVVLSPARMVLSFSTEVPGIGRSIQERLGGLTRLGH